jgi:Tol biopolymer transport system component
MRSADGTQVVYIDYHEPVVGDCVFRCGTLWSVAAAGGEPMRLTPELGSEVHPTVSPDGRWIAYVDESHADLVVIAPDGSGQRVLTPDLPSALVEAGPPPEVHWDPDSAGLTYLASATLWHVTLAGVATRIEAPAMSEFARQVLP